MASGMLGQCHGFESSVSSPAVSTKAKQFGGRVLVKRRFYWCIAIPVKISWHRGTKYLDNINVWYLQTLYATLLGQFFPKPRGGEITRNKLYISL